MSAMAGRIFVFLSDTTWRGVNYSAGDTIDTTNWTPAYIRALMLEAPVEDQAAMGSGGGGGGIETDPHATPLVTAETSRAEAAESSEASRAQAAEAAKAASSALTTETSRATAAEQAASTAASNEASRAQSAESAEATRAQAAEASGATNLTNHVGSATAHASDSVTFNDTGLIVVKGANVRAALAAADAWINARPTNEAGTLIAMPANGTRPDGSTYLATDQNGGTTYRMVAGVWTQQAAAVDLPRGKLGGQKNSVALNQVLTTTVDVPALNNCQFLYSGRPVSARVVLPWLKDTLVSSTMNVFITDVATGKVVFEEPNPTPAAATLFFTARAMADGVHAFADGTALVVGTTYTWKAQFQHAAAASGTVTSGWAANSAFYGYIEVVEE